MPPVNSAAWLVAEKQTPLEVKSAPYTSPGPNEIVVKNGAVAINPVDVGMQSLAIFPLNYPAILGMDTAGEIVEIGSAVTRFKVGDRVLGHAVSFASKRYSEAAFQSYTILLDNMTAQIPDNISFEAACVIPLGLSTAACGLYEKEYLALPYPSTNPKPTGQVLIVWGGSTSVGSNGIQLAISSGYEVFTTASPKNFNYVKKLGASQAFDYHSKTVVDDMVAALKGKTIAGALDCIGRDGAVELCADVVRQVEGTKFISEAWIVPGEVLGIKASFIDGGSLINNEISTAVYDKFLPKALAEGKFIPAPDPLVVGHGLESIQEALEAYAKGVSAQKIVITL